MSAKSVVFLITCCLIRTRLLSGVVEVTRTHTEFARAIAVAHGGAVVPVGQMEAGHAHLPSRSTAVMQAAVEPGCVLRTHLADGEFHRSSRWTWRASGCAPNKHTAVHAVLTSCWLSGCAQCTEQRT
jgi:hypothetical protein